MWERIHAVVVTFNNTVMLADLLEDLRLQTRLADKVFVIDNNSRDHTENLAKEKYPDAHYLFQLSDNL